MRSNELMIGDWYNWYADGKNYHYQVTKETFSNDDATIANFESIPLTPEILEKNGFVEDDEHDWFIYDDGNNYFIIEFCREIGTDEIVAESFMSFGRCECIYVHELQHDLKRCKLINLAENFKVK